MALLDHWSQTEQREVRHILSLSPGAPAIRTSVEPKTPEFTLDLAGITFRSSGNFDVAAL